ncbi:MAG: ABC transporter substrate-binding protein [Nitriliruptorales bacterium]|nr:ABC transporter substrate-binding protein [Nitriliruptorales bacterium]
MTLLLGACSNGDDPSAIPSPTPTAVASPTSAATATEEAGPRRGGTLRYALSNDPQAIDPRFVADDEGRVVVDAMFDSLVALDDDLEAVPAAAESWEMSEDATRFEFTLREGATFHDGSPVTAQDFVRAFNRVADGTADPRSFVAYQLAQVAGFEAAQREGAPLDGVEAVDEHTLVITLTEPFAEFIEVLADPSLGPVPAGADESPGPFGRAPIGNGPFQLSGEWAQGDFIRVARFEDYVGERTPWLDEVVFQIYADDPEQRSQYAAFEDGRLHVAEVPASRLQDAMSEPGPSPDGYSGPGVLTGPTATVYFYGFNTEQPPFDDPNVRRAVSLLIDREAIVEEITNETRQVADAIIPPPLAAHQEGACTFCDYDPERALQYWRGQPDPSPDATESASPPPAVDRGDRTLTIIHNEGRTHRAIAERIATALRETLEVDVSIESRELPEFIQALRAGEMGIYRLGWQADYPSAGSFLHPLFSSDEDNLDNLSRYRDEQVDELLAQARAETDAEARIELYRQIERHVLDRAVIAPIFVYRLHRVVAPEVEEFRYGPLGNVDLTRVWLNGTS